ncbi:PP2C family protein-serine/threonine phosphatase [Pseudodesulfovibrio piezophilus]|uniref:HAMP domain-containing protein n=1 Tax=Pseudodesulfovibrio piezophilus (strain DSM 21447 / JCM 15486 / C1TLV30) TaxID=1322246 RepID=M1WU43_PSEP2|nr:SpoIIE family protein phosphatase [Pseudodesulfovibrio piezophilus]CCH50217.1 putative Protein serine/threonine phosphatase [Pseudodesulfovibrio piezophilus C1TLV30]
MRIRSKLLILLLLVSLTPLLVVRATIRRDLNQMGDTLAERSANVLVHKASTGLTRIVEDHARVLMRERQLLESTSLLLASKLEGVLSGHAHTPSDSSFALTEEQVAMMAKGYYFEHMQGRIQSLHVDLDHVSVRNGDGREAMLHGLAALMSRVKSNYPNLILWIEMRLADGTSVVYPALEGRGMMRPRVSRMSMPQALLPALTWSSPQPDSRTRRMAFRVTSPIRSAKGILEGNLTIVVPVDSMLHDSPHVSMFSTNAQSFLVRPTIDTELGLNRIQIIAQQASRNSGRGHWQMPSSKAWLVCPNADTLKIITTSLKMQRPGVVDMQYQGSNSLWAYAPLDESGLALMLIVPKEDVVREAEVARQFIGDQVAHHDTSMGIVVLVVAGLALIFALVLSRLFTRNIRELADAVRSVAKGNFSVRAPIRSKDEVGQLSHAFNKMVPALKERVSMKNSLEMAQEVQQSLLPSVDPELPWVDVAAASMYCDETGGDYYGFVERRTGSQRSLVVAVGDVSGHGVQAALMMASARAYLRGELLGGASLVSAMETVNRRVFEDVDGSGRFMTLFLMELFEDGAVQWVRAGHDPALVYDVETGVFEELAGSGLPLGVIEDAAFEVCSRVDFNTGQIVLIGTDGIWEMRSKVGEMFGKERLKRIIRDNASGTSGQLNTALEQALTEFRGECVPVDDITVATLKLLR